MKLYIVLILCLFSSSLSFSQCEVKTIKLDGEYDINYMLERFYKNDDLENGLKTVYVFCNSVKNSVTEKVEFSYLVVTYAYSQRQESFIPGQISISLSNGSYVVINAKKKSTDTLNELKSKLPSGVMSVEGIFNLSPEDIKKLISSPINEITLFNTRENTSMDVTPSYKGVLIDMLNCTTSSSR